MGLLQGTHGAVHHPHRPAAGGRDAQESDGQGQQEAPPATLLPMTGPAGASRLLLTCPLLLERTLGSNKHGCLGTCFRANMEQNCIKFAPKRKSKLCEFPSKTSRGNLNLCNKSI